MAQLMDFEKCADALNDISRALNKEYGFNDGIPRINMGPCGPCSKIFFQAWNSLFAEKVTICFLFSAENGICLHCFIKLPDGNYFDAGHGVVAAVGVQLLTPGDSVISEMKVYDEKKLNRNAYGLDRKYVDCPGYSNRKTTQIILSGLQRLR
jgi:hypothetical protein